MKSILDQLRSLFEKDGKPESTADVLRGLEDMLGKNRMEYEEHDAELAGLAQRIQDEEARIAAGALSLLEEKRVLRRLDLLDDDMQAVDRLATINFDNIRRLKMLINKLIEMEAKGLAGVTESDIDSILEKFDEDAKEHERVNVAGRAGESKRDDSSASAEDERHAERKRKIKERAGEKPAAPGPKRRERE